jgi:hypothetical protein
MDRMGAEDPADFPAILARIGDREGELVHALLYEGHAYDFYKAIESAKSRCPTPSWSN